MLTNTLIRNYNPCDEKQLIKLWEKVFPNDPSHNSPKSMIAEKLAIDELIFVGYCGSQLVGACMAGYDGHRGCLYAVAVDPDYRRGGVGKVIVAHAMAELKGLGCHKVNLQIRSDNEQVQQFYASLGFAVEPRLSMGKHI